MGYPERAQMRPTAFYPDTIRLDGTKKGLGLTEKNNKVLWDKYVAKMLRGGVGAS